MNNDTVHSTPEITAIYRKPNDWRSETKSLGTRTCTLPLSFQDPYCCRKCFYVRGFHPVIGTGIPLPIVKVHEISRTNFKPDMNRYSREMTD